MLGPIGMQELIIIFVIALIVFGPRKLPQLGKSLGRSIAEFKRASNELRSTLEQEIRVEETRKDIMEPIESIRREADEMVRDATTAAEKEIDADEKAKAEKAGDDQVDAKVADAAAAKPEPKPEETSA